MTGIIRFRLGAVVFIALAGTMCAQSLADVARQQQSTKPKPKAARVYTNDDIPSVSTMREEPQSSSAQAKTDDEQDAKDKKAAAGEDKQKAQQEFKDKLGEQKKLIADLQHEIDLLDREYKLRSAVFYADAGNRLRDDKKWADEDRKYQDEMKKKRAALQDAQAKLESMRELARKAGISGALD